MGKKIDVMIIGAQKAGTTSLLRYLGEHPNCVSHQQKEFSYFTDPLEYKEGIKFSFSKFFPQFNNNKNLKIICKNASLYADEKALLRLKKNNPQCKLILILRNPVERTYSSYLMEKNYGSVNFEFSELPQLITKHKDNDESWGFNFFLNYGLYANYLKIIYNHFPKEQVHILLYRDIKNDALKACKDIFRFIGVPENFAPNVSIKHNVTKKTRSSSYASLTKRLLQNESSLKKILKFFIPAHKTYVYGELLRNVNITEERYEPMNKEVRNYLVEFFRPYNKELEKMIGRDLSDWNK